MRQAVTQGSADDNDEETGFRAAVAAIVLLYKTRSSTRISQQQQEEAVEVMERSRGCGEIVSSRWCATQRPVSWVAACN